MQLGRQLRAEIPTASIDNHGQWLQRLSSMARMMTLFGLFILALVFAATALCVVFATRGAMASNRIVIEVLHFVGAEDSYVAREFQRHFLLLGLKGAGMGGAVAAAIFLSGSLFGRLEGSTRGRGAAAQHLRRAAGRAERLYRLGDHGARACAHHRAHRPPDGAADAEGAGLSAAALAEARPAL